MLRVALSPWVLLLVGCSDGPGDTSDTADAAAFSVDFTDLELAYIKALGPLDAPPADPTNAWADDADAAHLGRWLFYDARFSADGTIACATCHAPALGFGDGLAVSVALGTTDRHAPTLWNTAYNRWYFWDGRADSHWSQALAPIEDPAEHGIERLDVYRIFAADAALSEAYAAVFDEALPEVPEGDWGALTEDDQRAVTEVFVRFGKAIAAYERQLIVDDTPWDTFVAGILEEDIEKTDALDDAAQRGLKLFVGEGNCHFCHAGPNFTNLEFHNIGLAPRDWLMGIDVGRYTGISEVLEGEFNGAGAWSDDPEAGAEKLRYLFQGEEHQGQFKVPTLRNLVYSAPYMHGGHFDTLEEVVHHYAALEEDTNVGHRDELIVKQDWSEEQIADLVRFLEALSADPDAASMSPELLAPPLSPVP